MISQNTTDKVCESENDLLEDCSVSYIGRTIGIVLFHLHLIQGLSLPHLERNLTVNNIESLHNLRLTWNFLQMRKAAIGNDYE